jgi:hypothetical protein
MTTPLTRVRVYLSSPVFTSYVVMLRDAIDGEIHEDSEPEVFAHQILEAAYHLDQYGRCGMGNMFIGVAL